MMINLITIVEGTIWNDINLPIGQYRAISSSVSGTNLSVLFSPMSNGNSLVYLSSNAGNIWNTSLSTNVYVSLSCAFQSSANGQYMYMGSNDIYVSSNWGNPS